MTRPNTSKPAASPNEHPLVGRELLGRREDVNYQTQATILAIVPSNSSIGDLALIQYYDWNIGAATTQQLIPLTELANARWWIFSDHVERFPDSGEFDENYAEHHNDAIPRKAKGRRDRGNANVRRPQPSLD
jgi:hypothetical protein